MKKLLSIVLALLTVFSLTATAAAAEFQVDTDKQVVNAGEEVTVTVTLDETITHEKNFRSCQGELYFDTDALTYVSHTMGEGYMEFSSKYMERKGRVQFSNTSFAQDGYAEIPAGTVITLVCKANETMTVDVMTAAIRLEMKVMPIGENATLITVPATIVICREHSFVGGVCEHCGTGEKLVKWASVNTSLTGSIDLNFYVILSDDLVNADTFVRFTSNGKTLDVPMSDAIVSVKNGVTRYRFSYKVYAKQMTDVVTAQVMTPDGPVGQYMPYSVAKYCYGMIDYSKNAEMVSLCKAMLNYGTAAQRYFGYKLEHLANADLSEADQMCPDFDPGTHAHSVVGSEDGIKASGAKLLLEADVAIQVSFSLTASKPIEAYTITIDGAPAAYTKFSGSKYYFELDGIAASRFDELHAFSVGGLTLHYGVLSYANQVYNNQNASETLIGLVNAMYAYHMVADAYMN